MMPQPPMTPNFLEPLEVVPHLLVDGIGQDMRAFPVDEVLLPVEKPVGDLELRGALHDADDPLEFVRVELAGSAPANQHGSDGGKGGRDRFCTPDVTPCHGKYTTPSNDDRAPPR